ncbi:acyl-CoA dehydrogenase family protein [Streptomyces sp. NPDC051561]|uniref:acyl-CoA dehydrogenase family protein n=1 Tax=Streptomyces sp. NPDC051561 TaxID=3365658 RepID=UPI0037B3D9F3
MGPDEARKAAETAGRLAAEADRSGRLADEVVDAVRAAGFARHFLDQERGGDQGSFEDLTRAVLLVGRSCAATAWSASLAAYSVRLACHLPSEGQRTVFAEGPDVLIATGLVPSGRAVRTDGGWRLTGSWGYVSGVGFADWVLLCAVQAPEQGKAPEQTKAPEQGKAPAQGQTPGKSAGGPPALRFFALPRAACAVRETWDNVGMRATGSHTVEVADAFVPESLSFGRGALLSGDNPHATAASHRVPFQAVAGITFVAPVVGAALGALDAVAATTVGRRRTPTAEVRLARASGLLEAARLLVRENARTVDAGRLDPETLAHIERNAVTAAELSADAVGQLVRLGGTSALAADHPAQRFWRDVVSATSHVVLQFETSAAGHLAEVLLGPAPQSASPDGPPRGGGPR